MDESVSLAAASNTFRCAPRCAPKNADDNEHEANAAICTLREEPQKDFAVSVWVNASKGSTLGKGTYGIVRTGSICINECADKNESAIKTFLGREGLAFSQTVLREIIPLCSLPAHENVLKPRVVYADEKNRIHFSSERMKSNLHERLKSSSATLDQKLEWSLQLIRAVDHMHSNGFLHRDIKLENVFLDDSDAVVLGDLGMSRFASPIVSPPFSSGVCTLWTRAPELCAYALDGRKNVREVVYDASVDCWSLGVTILSIFASRYFFQGKDEEDMLRLVFTTLGKPCEESESWGVCRETRNSKSRWKAIAQAQPLLSSNTNEVLDSLLIECSRRRITIHPDLLRSILPFLAMEPERRGSAREALENSYWVTVDRELQKSEKQKQKKSKATKKSLFARLTSLPPPKTEKEKTTKKASLVKDENVLFLSSAYYNYSFKCSTSMSTTTNLPPSSTNLNNEEDIYNSCTTRGVLRLAVTEWILSLQKSLSLMPLTIIDSILFWERVRDLVDVQVKNEMVLAAACCSLVSKMHEYTIYSSQRWIRCLSNSATVDDLVKYEMLALKTSNCQVFTDFTKHPMFILNTKLKNIERNVNVTSGDRDRILLVLCKELSQFHTRDIGIEILVSRSLLALDAD